MEEIIVKSTLDGTSQPSLFYYAGENRPLLVGLHTWSFGRSNQKGNMLPYAKKHGWNLLLPEFRGANVIDNPNRLKALGSPFAVQDVLDAIYYVCQNYKIDQSQIFLLGLSGGGHMALMTTAKNPTLFRAVGAFVPITDMLSWHAFNDAEDSYRPHIEGCIGGSPSEVGKNAYLERSPISYINELSKANIKLFHGKFDTTVPYTQSVELFRLITEKDAKSRVFLDLFDGGHEIDMDSAIKWFLSQVEDKNLTKVTG